MKSKKVSISINEREEVSGVLSVPDGFKGDKGTGLILAHGAGNDMENPLLVFLSEGLAKRGILTLRFNFPYKEKGKKAPDSPKKLVETWSSVFRFFKKDSGYGLNTILVSGKSMGGRIASQMVAEGLLPAQGVILYGYPLHPPGRKDKLRDAHLYDIKVPMLFFAGTRDALCDLTLLKSVLNRLKGAWSLEIIQGGDHSFKVLKSADPAREVVHDRILRKTFEWIISH